MNHQVVFSRTNLKKEVTLLMLTIKKNKPNRQNHLRKNLLNSLDPYFPINQSQKIHPSIKQNLTIPSQKHQYQTLHLEWEELNSTPMPLLEEQTVSQDQHRTKVETKGRIKRSTPMLWVLEELEVNRDLLVQLVNSPILPAISSKTKLAILWCLDPIHQEAAPAPICSVKGTATQQQTCSAAINKEAQCLLNKETLCSGSLINSHQPCLDKEGWWTNQIWCSANHKIQILQLEPISFKTFHPSQAMLPLHQEWILPWWR